MRDPLTPLKEVEFIPRNRVLPLAKLGLRSLGDLVRHYPRRYEDRRSFGNFPDSAMDTPVCIAGHVAATQLKRFGYRKGAYEITLENASQSAFSQPVICRWFNMPYMQNVILTGHDLVIYGRPKMRGKQVVIDHPEYEILEEEESRDSLHMQRIVPIHPAGEGVTTRQLRNFIHQALEQTSLGDVCFLKKAEEPSIGALQSIHFPASLEEAAAARNRLALDECFAIQIVVHKRRAEWAGIEGISKPPGELTRKFRDALPFALTPDQQDVVDMISRDLASPSRMNRLLQGDVGAGKTIVAVSAIVQTIDAGYPAAIMAPTQILAEQHFATFRKLLEPLGIPVHLKTGLRKTGGDPLFDAHPPAVVGTHALLFEEESDFRPGLVVIDEQHKFGVLQRARLAGLPSKPDVLVMTATPIPRTLAQTLYGDLEVSVIRGKPPGRGSIKTAVRTVKKFPEVVEFVRRHLEKGRQAYVVYPLVEESDKLAAKAATAEFLRWQELLAPLPVGLLHGRTEPEEKDAVMTRFRKGETSVLVSTTVIEVGVDVPNATILVVENAERFGLAQLHQLRGRIGRGTANSFCILLHSADTPAETIEKLAILEKTSDGFEIAEEDLRLRGPGNVLGTEQTGLPPLKLADFLKDRHLMERASSLAAETLRADPNLSAPDNAALKELCLDLLGRALASAG